MSTNYIVLLFYITAEQAAEVALDLTFNFNFSLLNFLTFLTLLAAFRFLPILNF